MSKIAVITPIYNVELYLKECIESIIAQTYTDLLIILVNDGSTDKSLDIAKKFAQTDERIIIIDKENAGVGMARNAGLSFLYNSIGYNNERKKEDENLNEFKVIFKNQIQNSNQWRIFAKTKNPIQEVNRIEFISFVDSDDIIKPQTYEQAIIPMKKDKHIDCVIFGAEIFGEVEQKCIEQLNKYLKIKHNGKVEISEQFMLETVNACWNKLFRFDLMQKHKLYFPPTQIGEDESVKLCYLALCKSIYLIDAHLYLYRQRNNSITYEIIDNKACYNIDVLYNFKYIAQFYQKNGLLTKKFSLLCQIYAKLVKDALWMNERIKAKEIFNIASSLGKMYLGQNCLKNIFNCNRFHYKFKFGNENFGLLKELLCVDLMEKTIFVKRKCYFLCIIKKHIKIFTTIYAPNYKITYAKIGSKKFVIRKKITD